ncbi:hypothetical protein HW115_14210 [Verrucomicrobiaceae bacterium N1E253]|uniref:Uncharacterized protein n=1 Tax=Oceaniferula marina TaxID=2748318 RepID=A0A851GIK6_9BACT|nr:hypothetical protein [Oceaniferula marina]NWK56772.1 hypothetical protein [Oceaniferula marina]
MNITTSILSALCFSLAAVTAAPVLTGKPSGQILATGSRRVVLLDQQGKVTWQHKGDNTTDCWMLANGNVLFTDNGVHEVNPSTGEKTFTYQSNLKKGGGVFGCQPLADNKILIGENSTGKLLEMTRDGKVTFELQLPIYQAGSHHNLRMVRKLDNGNYLVCHSGKHLVREYTPEGKVVFEVKVDNIAFTAIRLENGNTLVGHIDAITEFTPKGKTVWSFNKTELEGISIATLCGIHVQPNGNLCIGTYASYKKGGQVGLIEITREKKLVWKYANPKGDRSMMSMQMLTPQGKKQAGKLLR